MNCNYFILIPLNLVYDEKYADVSVEAVLMYSLFLNRMRFSMQNKKFKDEKGVFIYYSERRISEQVHCSINSAKKALRELEKAELIKKEYQKNGLPIKIYVNDIFHIIENKYSCKSQEKEVSFDVEKAERIANMGVPDFVTKKNPRRKRKSSSSF